MKINYAEKVKLMEEMLRYLHERNRELGETIRKLRIAEKSVGSLISATYKLKESYKNLEELEKVGEDQVP